VVTIWLVSLLRDAVTWPWAFALLALGPVLGVAAMLLNVRGFAGRDAELAQLNPTLQAAAGEATAVVISAMSGTAGLGRPRWPCTDGGSR
jgi:hypothetical protein